MNDKILESRENRYIKQEEILKEYPFSLISFTLNIPGAIKDNNLIRKIHNEGIKAIIAKLSSQGTLWISDSEEAYIKYKEIRNLDTGPEAFISIDLDHFKLKKIMVDIEESHALGRLFDIDVFDSNHLQVNRSIIGKQPRKCLLCDEFAINCIKTKKHSYEELIKKIEKMCESELFFEKN